MEVITVAKPVYTEVEIKLQNALSNRTEKALEIIKEKGYVAEDKRAQMDRNLNSEIVSILLKGGIDKSLSGMQNPLFREVYRQSLMADLKTHPQQEAKKILLAYGYSEVDAESKLTAMALQKKGVGEVEIKRRGFERHI